MTEHPIQGLMKTAMENIKEMVDVNTIVGDPVETPDGSVIMPISKVGFGFAAGGSEFGAEDANLSNRPDVLNAKVALPFGGGSGGGVSITPIAFLVVSNQGVKIVPLDNQTHLLERLIDSAPTVVDKIQSMIKGGMSGMAAGMTGGAANQAAGNTGSSMMGTGNSGATAGSVTGSNGAQMGTTPGTMGTTMGTGAGTTGTMMRAGAGGMGATMGTGGTTGTTMGTGAGTSGNAMGTGGTTGTTMGTNAGASGNTMGSGGATTGSTMGTNAGTSGYTTGSAAGTAGNTMGTAGTPAGTQTSGAATGTEAQNDGTTITNNIENLIV